MTDDSGFSRVQTTRVFEEIASQIRLRLVTGRLRPGDRLPSEREFAQQLGVGRNSVREALRALEVSGLLRLLKGGSGGAFIAQPTGDVVVSAMQDMYQLGAVTPQQFTEARIGLSELIVRLACERYTAVDLTQLEANVEAATRASERHDYVSRARISLEFHQILSRATGNPLLVAMTAGMLQIMGQFIDRLGAPSGPYVLPSRKAFLRHFRRRDTAKASAEMTRLLQRVHSYYLSQFPVSPPPSVN
jgi:GntR family transcriptional regulator, transcriptional repressor for pyruvate dehydrogenase complex